MVTSRRPKRARAPRRTTQGTTRTRAHQRAPGGKVAGARVVPRRADFGAPADGFFAKQPPHLRAILETLRMLIEEAAPEATGSIKWGMPWFSVDGEMMCALGGHKSHVNLILPGPPGTFADPDERLEGEGKTGRHLKVRAIDELPRAAVRGWLRTAAKLAREKAARR